MIFFNNINSSFDKLSSFANVNLDLLKVKNFVTKTIINDSIKSIELEILNSAVDELLKNNMSIKIYEDDNNLWDDVDNFSKNKLFIKDQIKLKYENAYFYFVYKDDKDEIKILTITPRGIDDIEDKYEKTKEVMM